MKIHEYQAKEILEEFNVPVQQGILATKRQEAEAAFEKLGKPLAVVKAQVHAGGRGKGGGVKLVRSAKEAGEVAEAMLSKRLVTPQTRAEGVPVHKVLLCPGVSIEKEYYAGMVIDPSCGPVIMASAEGGVEIEEVAKRSPEKIFKEFVDVTMGLIPFQARRMAYRLGFSGDAVKQVCRVLHGIASAFVAYDCSIVEINPLVKTKEGDIIALDAKIVFDDNALFRHAVCEKMRDDSETPESEILARQNNLSYIQLDGNIGCLVNGAGLAMATMDIVKAAGGEPANFLDVGGGAKEEQVVEALKIILRDPKIKAILVNIFGGITKCDVIAQGIVKAAQIIHLKVPLVVSMEGTNLKEAQAILEKSTLKIITASGLKEAAEKVVAAAR